MPEGDTVFRAAQTLNRALRGRALTRSDFRVPAHATADLRGWMVTETLPRGKHLLTRLHHPDRESDLTLHTHLGMDGSWRVGSAGRPAHHRIRVVLHSDAVTVTGWALPAVNLVRSRDEDQFTRHLGPDCLGADWDSDLAAENVRKNPSDTVGQALLDQRNLAGVGNIFCCETLFVAGIHPRALVSDVLNLETVVTVAAALLQHNRERQARQTTDVVPLIRPRATMGVLATESPDDNLMQRFPGAGRTVGNARSALSHSRNTDSHYVYGRAGRPCRVCASTIRQAKIGAPGRERPTYWCPRCQPAR